MICKWCGGEADERTCPLGFTCPTCQQPPGSPCKRPSGHGCVMHAPRRDLEWEAMHRLEIEAEGRLL